MPQIFDKIGRDKVREQLLEAGFQLIKQYGLKKTSVSDIAKAAGMATGTFYNFYPSKEEFVYQIVLYNRGIVKGYFENLIKDGKISKEDFRQYLRKIYLSDNNIFDYLNDDEISMLNARWPEEYRIKPSNDETTSKWILEHLEIINPQCNWKVFANLSKSISLIRYGKTRLYQDEYEEAIDIYIDAIIRYVFGE
ncbi:MAG: TetR/AcrR family transcriptional regulator [Suipraeoptans sp.]